jgi:hypothetical protein
MKSRAILALTVCLLSSGCDDTKNPLSDPQTSKADEQLIGVWRINGEETFYHVGHAGGKFPAGMLRIVEIRHAKGSVEPPEEYLAFTTVLGEKTYLNVVLDGDHKQVQRFNEKGWSRDAVDCYTLLKYQLDGDKLVAYLMDEDAKQKAIDNGKIKGTVDLTKPAKFNDTTENIARFVAQADDGLWNTKDRARLERIKTEPPIAVTVEKNK